MKEGRIFVLKSACRVPARNERFSMIRALVSILSFGFRLDSFNPFETSFRFCGNSYVLKFNSGRSGNHNRKCRNSYSLKTCLHFSERKMNHSKS
ncbi:hypothetical protein LEP1GSC052_2759 [Leptospira kmetyi serovar Malaysia str. Bejo-Iso9]|nr:hypothetical protein LEP1GSC052_2759 [Leptospira kmetyi serovar Malaysia str. Bejo-Iso9]